MKRNWKEGMIRRNDKGREERIRRKRKKRNKRREEKGE
jgi:hypothetical protein